MIDLASAPLASLDDYGPFEASCLALRGSGEAGDRESYLEILRYQAAADLYCLMRMVLVSSGAAAQCFPDGKRYIEHPFAYEMARSVQYDYKDVMVMAARGHGKSITVTLALLIWLYIEHPDWTFCIWSVTRALAKEHLQAIRDELEMNELLHELWPDRFWESKAARRAGDRAWSLDGGLAMPLLPPGPEKTFEAWGLTDVALPTGKHFKFMAFDDIIDERSVSSPEMIAQSRSTYNRAGGFESPGGCDRTHVGTPYRDGDTGVQLVEDGVVKLRCRPAVDETRQDTANRRILGGAPVFMTEEELLKRRKRMGAADYAIQMMMDARKGQQGTLSIDDLRYYSGSPHSIRYGMNVYLLVDPNGGFQATKNDAFALLVVGLNGDKNFYLLDGYIGHLDPSQRQRLIIEKRAEWEPTAVRIEEKTSQVESYWLREKQEALNHRFEIESINPQTMKKGTGSKGHYTRVDRLTDAWQPLLEQHRLYLPEDGLWIDVASPDPEHIDLVARVKGEIKRFPIAKTDDILSAFALLFEDHDGKRGAMPLIWPAPMSLYERHFHELPEHETPSDRSWMMVG